MNAFNGFDKFDTVVLVGGLVVLSAYLIRKGATAAVEGIGSGIGRLNEGVDALINPESVTGPKIRVLEPAANDFRNQYLDLGFAYYDADGNFQITEKGEQYIREQNAINSGLLTGYY